MANLGTNQAAAPVSLRRKACGLGVRRLLAARDETAGQNIAMPRFILDYEGLAIDRDAAGGDGWIGGDLPAADRRGVATLQGHRCSICVIKCQAQNQDTAAVTAFFSNPDMFFSPLTSKTPDTSDG